MNRIFKTVFNANTGTVVVVSENTSSTCRSQISSSQQKPNKEVSFYKQAISTSKSLLSILVGSIVATSTSLYAQSYSYTGNSSDLVSSNSVSSTFPNLINDSSNIQKGIFIQSGGQATSANAETTIDYVGGNIPQFVVSGYASASIDQNSETATTSGNSVILKQGNVIGPVYSELGYANQTTSLIDCMAVIPACTSITGQRFISNKSITGNGNTIISDGVNALALGSLNTGLSLIDLGSGGYTSATVSNSGLLNVSVVNTATVNLAASNNTLSGSGNEISLGG